MSDAKTDSAFDVQGQVRGPWRAYLDALSPLRPALHRYCCRLTGSVWDGEDLLQDTLLRMFGSLGKTDRDLENPQAYFIRTATHLWIDQQRRLARHRVWQTQQSTEESATATNTAEQAAVVRQAARDLLKRLPPRERAAVVMREVLDLSAREAASFLQISEGAVKAALHRARERLQTAAVGEIELETETTGPPHALVEKFLNAMATGDMATLQAICSADIAVELVGGARSDSFDDSNTFFAHARWVPSPEMAAIARAMVLGTDPRWQLQQYLGEWIVLGFRTWEGLEGLNEIHRLEEVEGKITRVRCYCFCPDALQSVGEQIGVPAIRKPYRSPG